MAKTLTEDQKQDAKAGIDRLIDLHEETLGRMRKTYSGDTLAIMERGGKQVIDGLKASRRNIH